MKYYCMRPDFRKEITGEIYPQIQEYYNLDYSGKGHLFTAHLVHTYNATFVNRSRYYDKIYSKKLWAQASLQTAAIEKEGGGLLSFVCINV